MKKLLAVVALSTFLLPNVVFATTTTSKQDVDSSKYEYPSLTLIKEKYDGKLLMRFLKYNDTERKDNTYVDYIEVPKTIQKKVKASDDKAIQNVTALLASEYDSKGVNDIVRLNELFLQFIPEIPNSKITVSKEYGPTFSDNLKLSLNYIEDKRKVTLTNEEKTTLASTFNSDKNFVKKFTPYQDKNALYKETQELADQLSLKWYQKTVIYVIGGIVIILAAVLFIFFRRR